MANENGKAPWEISAKHLMRVLVVLLCLCAWLLPVSALAETILYVSETGNDASGAGTAAAPYKTMNKAVAAAPTNSATTILVSGTVACETTVDIYNSKDICVKTADGDTSTLVAGSGFPSGASTTVSYLFQVDPKSKLTFDGAGLTLKPGKSGAGFVRTGGDLVINNGTFTNANIYASSGNGAFRINFGGTLTLNGGTITKTNIENYYNAVILQHNNSSVTINSGTITDNTIGGNYYNGVLLLYGSNASATMNGGEISKNGIKANWSGTVMTFGNETSFTLKGGAIKDNTADATLSTGGVYVFAYQSGSTATSGRKQTFTMTGGEISGNAARNGAGVFLSGADPTPSSKDLYSRATFVMTGGVIKENIANRSGNYTGIGGGVYVYGNSEFTMNDGEISGNKAYYWGGGVAIDNKFTVYYKAIPYSDATGTVGGQPVSKWDTFFPAIFTMNGGKISGNRAYIANGAGGEGGGVYAGSSHVTLNAGLIADNTADRHGGGVYVLCVPYDLHISDAVIRANTASSQGGGVWACPTGAAVIYLGSRCGIFANSADKAGDDYLNVVPPANTTLAATIGDTMLGGGLQSWFRDGAVLPTSPQELPRIDTTVPRYSADSGVPIRNIVNSLHSYALKSISTEADQQLARVNAKLDIFRNSATYGGGIATNGPLYIGDSAEYTFLVQKKLAGTGDSSGKAFTFTIASASPTGAPMPNQTTVSVTGAGIANFGTVTYTQAGAFAYTIREQAGADPAVTYDPAMYTVTITTTEKNGSIVVSDVDITCDKGLPGVPAEKAGEVIFTNTVAAAPGEYMFTAKKALAGTGDGSGKTFRFLLEGSAGAPMPATPTASVTGAGEVSFGKVSFRSGGTYTYTIREEQGNDPLVTYDPAVYTVKITTTIEKGTVVVSSVETTCQQSHTQTTGSEILFTNTVALPTAVEYGFQVEKKLTGTGGTMKPFSFRLHGANGAPMPPAAACTITGAGTVSFGKASFHSAGTYTYTLTEEKGSDPEVIYDTAIYTVTITTATEQGNIVISDVQVHCLRDGVSTVANGVLFHNKVTQTPALPQTGDNAWPGLWGALALCALVGMAALSKRWVIFWGK